MLKSWAVTKGPSAFPGDKRLAVQVEDHPMEYGGFEGTIPKGQYGGGTVMVWDRGGWVPRRDVDQGLEDGHLKFELHGEKLKGSWALVRMHGRASGSDKPNWLLIKEKDEFAQRSAGRAIVDTVPDSALTGRTLEEIAGDNSHTWRSNGKEKKNAAKASTTKRPSIVHSTLDSSKRRHSEDGGDSKTRSKINRGERNGVSTLAITHPDKILDAQSGLTKQELAEYYLSVKDHLLPHVAGRPLSIVRCPSGSSKPCFFQKHVGSGLPNGMSGLSIKSRKSGEKDEYLTLNSAEGLVGLAQMGVLEIHTRGSRNDAIEKPDRIVFDLDPDASIDWSTLAETAARLRKRLREFGLESFLKSTGGKGLHVVIPITPEHEWPEIKAFAHGVVLEMESEWPDLYVTKMTKAVRKNHIYLDYLRNDREATSIAPFSPRARVGAPVAMPLHWRELRAESRPVFQVTGFAQWRARLRRDPWDEISDIRQNLSKSALEIAHSVARKHRR